MAMLKDVSDAQWNALAGSKLYFGHESVGGNILDGVTQILAENPHIPLRIVESGDPAEVQGGALVHSRLGNNGNPGAKAGAFEARVSRGLGPSGGIAMYKLCYVDFDVRTDVQTVFQAYREGIERVRATHPDIRIAHITVPVTTKGNPVKEFLRRRLGRPTYADVNVKRNDYNRLIRGEYGQRDPIFDLARVEATHADGTLEAFRHGKDSVLTLAPEFTDDGGHLNAPGRRRVAEAFLVFLATIASSSR